MNELTQIFTELCPGVDPECTSLVDDGEIDSLDIVSLVSEIMDAFSVVIPVEEIIPENFNSLSGMMSMIQRLS